MTALTARHVTPITATIVRNPCSRCRACVVMVTMDVVGGPGGGRGRAVPGVEPGAGRGAGSPVTSAAGGRPAGARDGRLPAAAAAAARGVLPRHHALHQAGREVFLTVYRVEDRVLCVQRHFAVGTGQRPAGVARQQVGRLGGGVAPAPHRRVVVLVIRVVTYAKHKRKHVRLNGTSCSANAKQTTQLKAHAQLNSCFSFVDVYICCTFEQIIELIK